MIEPQSTAAHQQRFSNLVAHRVVSSGHNTPHDNPQAVTMAVLDLHRRRTEVR